MKRSMLQYYFLLALNVLTVLAARCTKTKTVYTTTTLRTKQKSSTLPSTTVTQYSSTVLVGTPYAGPNPVSTPSTNPTNCAYTTLTPEAAEAATKCTKTTITATVNKQCTVTHVVFPGPVFESGDGVLTTQVPSFCTKPGRQAVNGNGVGNSLTLLGYPYFPLNPVDCCIYCAKQITADLVAAGQVIDCQCLIDVEGDYPGKNKICPRGIEPYNFGQRTGVGFPGPCRTKSAA